MQLNDTEKNNGKIITHSLNGETMMPSVWVMTVLISVHLWPNRSIYWRGLIKIWDATPVLRHQDRQWSPLYWCS